MDSFSFFIEISDKFVFLFLYNPLKFHNTPSHRLKNSLEFVGTYEGGIFLPSVVADFLRGNAHSGGTRKVGMRNVLFFVCVASTESTVYFHFG